MAQKKSEFLSAFGKAFQVWKALTDEVLGLGGSDEHIRSIETDKILRRKLAELIVGAANTSKQIVSVVATFARDMRNEGWELIEDTPVREGETLNVSTLEAVSFLKDGENWIKSDEMRRRAVELGANFGQRHAEALLVNPHLIPAELRPYYLVFPGTVWQNRCGNRYVPYLCWRGGRWGLDFNWLDDDWDADDRLLRSRK